MTERKLDEAVKPPTYTSPQEVLSAVLSASPTNSTAELIDSKKPSLDPDPISNLPSSPPQIYLNLLILEASFRSQYLTLRARRRQHVFFLTLLAAWIAYFLWTLFLRPREDGQGLGGSVYWVVDIGEKVACMGGILTAILIWATGQWERGVRWPRRFVGITNRGLRGMNLKIVVLNGAWWNRLGSSVGLLFSFGNLFHSPGSDFHVIDDKDKRRDPEGNYAYREGYRTRGTREEDIAPGGDTIKLLLLPKHFSPEFRENWEIYRTEYWEKENERRAALRTLIKTRKREVAKQQGGLLWWTGYRGFAKTRKRDGKLHDSEKVGGSHHHRDSKGQHRFNLLQTHSRSSSRSSQTPPPTDNDEMRSSVERARSLRKSRLNSVTGSARHGKSASRTYQLTMSEDPSSKRDEAAPQAVHKRSSTLRGASESSNEG